MNQDPKEPRQFTCFDDHDNDGWGNSTLDPIIPEPDPLDELELDDTYDMD